MIQRNSLILHWDEYDKLNQHINDVAARSALRAKIRGWAITARDYAADTWDMSPKHDKLSDISSALSARLESWYIRPSCSYTKLTKQLMLRLNFLVSNVADPDFAYTDDAALSVHIELQLLPAFDIISRYLKVDEVDKRVIRVLELQQPRVSESKYIEAFRDYYDWHVNTSTAERVGMPYAMSVFLTYASFDF